VAQAIGMTLPLAIGIAVNPIAIVACIALLASPRGQVLGVALVAGWIAALITLIALGAVLTRREDSGSDGEPSRIAAWSFVIAGVLLVGLSIRTWRSRPSKGETPSPPRWLHHLSKFGTAGSLGVGAVLMVASAKNLTLAPAAGNAIAESSLVVPESAIVGALFVAIGSLGLLIPLSVSLFGGAAAARTLEEWHSWLVLNNSTITAVLFLILGTHLLGEGLGGV
jgi:hypothetical protein